jgi:hypothetical protein
MANGRKHIIVPDEIYERARKYYDEHKEELKIKYKVRSPGSFLSFCLRECLKKKEIIS